tara:strand:+ start:1032 stop:1325 length:294 start_codon:yes stop_codon:yes gene_type:complete
MAETSILSTLYFLLFSVDNFCGVDTLSLPYGNVMKKLTNETKRVDCCACGTVINYVFTAEMRKLTGDWGEPNSLLCDACAKALAQQSPAKGPEHDPR